MLIALVFHLPKPPTAADAWLPTSLGHQTLRWLPALWDVVSVTSVPVPPLPRLPWLQLPRPLCPVPRHHATTSGCCASPATCVPPPQDATPLLSSSLSSHPTTRLVAVRSCWYLGKCVSLLIDDDDFAILNYLLLWLCTVGYEIFSNKETTTALENVPTSHS
jgi:hypothetical protein